MNFLFKSQWLRKLRFWSLYRNRPPWDTGISPPELWAFIRSHPPGKALDLGCGTGTNVITLAQNGWQAMGVDFIRRAIASAKQKAQAAGVQASFHVGDVTDLRLYSPPYDLILDMGCLHSLSPALRAAYIHNLEWLLAPQGTFLLYAFLAGPGSRGPGLSEADLQAIGSHLVLEARQDGTDSNWRASAWFTYRKTASPGLAHARE